MLCSFYKKLISKASFLLIFLCVSCNQKQTQNADLKQEKSIPVAENAGKNSTTSEDSQKNTPPNSRVAEALQGAKAPTLIYGSNPTYVQVEKSDAGWNCKFVEDASLDDPGMIDLSFKFQPKSGIEFNEHEASNKHGLYFGKIPTKTKITVCGPTSCSIVNHQEIVVIKTNPEQFEQMFKVAKEFKPNEIVSKVWNLYFFDSSLKNFQSNQPAKLNFEKEPSIDWNGVLDQTGVAPLVTEGKSLMELRWLQTEKEVLVGKYKVDDKEYSVIGIQQFTIDLENSKP
jgi:hypothetical protein